MEYNNLNIDWHRNTILQTLVNTGTLYFELYLTQKYHNLELS